MSLVSSMNLGSLSSGLKKHLLKPIKHFNPAGLITITPSLKKSQKRKSGYIVRRRSQFSARSDASPNLGTSRSSTRNSQHGSTQYSQDFWNNRIILRTVPLSFPGSFQRQDIYSVSGENPAQLFPAQSLSHSRQCLLSQRPCRMGLVSQSSSPHRSLQSTGLFAGTQCLRANLAPYTNRRYAQQVFLNADGASNDFNFYFSQYSAQSISSSRVSSSLSIELCRFIYAILYIKQPIRIICFT